MSDDNTNFVTRAIHEHGGIVAMVAAAALTAKGEWDLAVMVHYPKPIAWLLPVALDVYLATAAAKRAKVDIVIGLLLMIACQVAVHLVPKGHEAPWQLVVGAVCVPPIIALRATLGMKGNGEAEEQAAREQAAAEELRAARQAAAEADRLRIEAEARLAEEERARQVAEAGAAALREVDAQAREAQTAREAAEERARLAEERAARAEFRAARARTDSNGGSATRPAPAARVTKPVTPPVTQSGGQDDAPVTRPVTHVGDAPQRAGDASTATGDASGGGGMPAGDASLTRDERLTLAVMEALNDPGVSARQAALKHGVDQQAVQRRVRAARAAEAQEPRPLSRPAVNGVKPDLNSNA
ncbi:hypothetical protein AB0B39_23740 [Micromonospora sp. NPDC049114]|uniref:hypothetical protein n=1 Tax=Micromonospora sp. NPDC049114 TaxID=3155498 RepID=UPI0033E5E1D9